MPEISEQQLQVLTNGMKLLEEMSTRPDTRRAFEKMVKTIKPEIETTEDIAAAAAAPYVEQLEATNKKLDDFLAAQAEAKTTQEQADADRARDAAFDRLKAQGYTEDGLTQIKAMMVDRKIADPEAAAALFDRLHPAPEPGQTSPWEPNYLNIKEEAVDHDIEGLFKNPDTWADKRIGQILLEERSNQS